MSLDQELVDSFRGETKVLLKELSEVVTKLEDGDSNTAPKLLSEFAQKIDRVMGAAKTISMMDAGHAGLIRIGKLAEICKFMGYKAAELNNAGFLPFFSAFWSDTLEIVDQIVDCLEDPAKTTEAVAASKSLQDRLLVLATQVDPSLKNLAQGL